MNSCSKGHQWIQFCTEDCPVCNVLKMNINLEATMNIMVDVHREQMSSLRREVEQLREPVICAVKVIREEMLREQASS